MRNYWTLSLLALLSGGCEDEPRPATCTCTVYASPGTVVDEARYDVCAEASLGSEAESLEVDVCGEAPETCSCACELLDDLEVEDPCWVPA